MCYIHVAKHRTYDQSPKALEDFVIFQMESIRCLFAPPIDKVCSASRASVLSLDLFSTPSLSRTLSRSQSSST